jgi:chromosome segregation ATPase
MNLDDAIEQYRAAKTKVSEAVRAANDAQTALKERENDLKTAAKVLNDYEEKATAARRALAAIAKRIQPLLSSEVSGICGRMDEEVEANTPPPSA